MTNGLAKERMTVFAENGIAYQAFNTILGTSKVMRYVKIDNKYVCCAEFNIDHKITVDELKLIAVEEETTWELDHIERKSIIYG